jgi:transposase-like protein
MVRGQQIDDAQGRRLNARLPHAASELLKSPAARDDKLERRGGYPCLTRGTIKGLAELGEFLRKNGIHGAQLEQWRKEALAGLGAPLRQRSTKNSPEAKKIRELEREVTRKDKALAETAALLVLKKKAQAIWGDEDDDTIPRNGK